MPCLCTTPTFTNSLQLTATGWSPPRLLVTSSGHWTAPGECHKILTHSSGFCIPLYNCLCKTDSTLVELLWYLSQDITNWSLWELLWTIVKLLFGVMVIMCYHCMKVKIDYNHKFDSLPLSLIYIYIIPKCPMWCSACLLQSIILHAHFILNSYTSIVYLGHLRNTHGRKYGCFNANHCLDVYEHLDSTQRSAM